MTAQDEIHGWLRPSEALAALTIDWDVGANEIARQLWNGRIRSGADLTFHKNGRQQEQRGLIPKEWWGHVPNLDNSGHAFWQTGGLSFFHQHSSRSDDETRIEAFDIRLEPVGILAPMVQRGTALTGPAPVTDLLGPAAVAALTSPSVPDSMVNIRGAGRSPLPYWEEAVLMIAQRMSLGDFKPQRQAEVGRALADWIVAKGYPEPGPTQLKKRAKMVFDLFKD